MPLFLTRLFACSPILMGVVHLHVSSSCYYFFKCGRFALIQLGAEQQKKNLERRGLPRGRVCFVKRLTYWPRSLQSSQRMRWIQRPGKPECSIMIAWPGEPIACVATFSARVCKEEILRNNCAMLNCDQLAQRTGGLKNCRMNRLGYRIKFCCVESW